MKKTIKKTGLSLVCVLLAFVLFVAQLFVVPMIVFADDPLTPPAMPTGYKTIRTLAGNVDFTGDFSGGYSSNTRMVFSTINLKKYDYLEFDVYFNGDDTGWIRFYFLDDSFKGEVSGRGVYDISVTPCEWTHVKIAPNQFATGYGMNGDVTRMCGTQFERMNGGNSSERIIVANMCVTANYLVSPDSMPDRLLINVGVDVDLTAADDLEPDAGKANIEETNFTFGDFVEMDYYIESKEETDKSAIALYDAEGNKSVYTFKAACNGWNHLKIPDTVFEGDANLTKIVKYGCDKSVTGNVYHFANLCVTGVSIPGIFPENTAVKFPLVLDYTGTKSDETVTPLENTVDMTKHDFIEFDLYLESVGSFKQPYFFIYDSGFNGSGKPLAANRLQYKLTEIENNKWNHVKISTDTMMNGTGGDISKATGIYISNLSANTRYIIADLCLTDLVIPEKKNVFTEMKSVSDSVKYRGSDYKAMQVFLNENHAAFDISGNDFVEFDFYVFSENATEQVKFGVTDGNYDGTNGVSTKSEPVTSNEWSHILLPVSSLSGGANLTKAISLAVVPPKADLKYLIYNVAVTDVLAPEMNNDFKLKKELGVNWDYSGKDPYATIKRYDTVNFEEYGYVEFDVCVLSDSAERSIRLYFLDETFNNGLSGKGCYDISINSNDWQHVVIPLSSFNTGYGMNGDRTRANGFLFDKLVAGERLIVTNVCLTDLEKPELHTKYSLKKETNVEINYTGNNPHETITEIESSDMLQYDFTEFDVFVYGDDSTIRLFFLDSTFNGAVSGRGAYDFSVKPKQWNHIVISNPAFNTGYGMNGNKNDVCGYELDFLEAGNQYVITNFCYTSMDVPEMNNKYELKKDLPNVKWNFSGVSQASATKMSTNETIDATQYQCLEFDIYVDSASTDIDLRMFYYDSTYDGQSGGRGFTNMYLTANQWNHMVINLEDFNTGFGMNGDPSTLSGFHFDFLDANNGYYIYNMCFTSRKQSVPYDKGNRPAKPDRNARYISNCDAPLDELGAWNSNEAYFTTDYKTEGTNSIALKVDNQPENVYSFKFGFDQPANFSKTELIRFDLMIDNIKLAQKTTATVILSSNRRANSDNHTYELNFSRMKEGWNSVELPISAFKGEADLSSISCFAFVMNSTQALDDFFVLCLDNLRAAKTFTVAGNSQDKWDNDFGIDDDDYYYYEDDDDPRIDNDVIKKGGNITRKIIRRYKKNGDSGLSVDMIVLISVSSVCLLLILSVVLFLLFTKRKLDRMCENQP